MNSHPDWRPSDASERIRVIDILRGLALFGVLIVNILSGFRVPMMWHIRGHFAGLRGIDYLVELLASLTLEFKALSVFSFLFGVGMAIQTERAGRRNAGPRHFLFRRLAWLLVLGVAHLLLVWNGDILTLYAICGLFFLPLISAPWQVLLVLGAAFITAPQFVGFGFDLPSGTAATDAIAQARQIYGNEGFVAILRFRWHETSTLIAPLLVSVLPRTVGLIYWGASAWRSGILSAPEKHRGMLTAVLVIGGVIGGAVTANDVWTASSGTAPLPMLNGIHLDAAAVLAMAYVAALLLWLNSCPPSRFPRLASLGQMALTNYLVQSVVLGFVFYGYGFGLFGRIGSAASAGIGVVLYLTQLQLSRYWLQRFRFGPVEWLWRSLAYGRRQPMRQGPTDRRMEQS